MQHRLAGLLIGGLLALAAPAVAGAATVHVRVEGTSGTLVDRTVTTNSTPVVKDGNPSHSCSGQSAAGALELATGGDWSGSYSDGLGYFVTTIKGETHSGSPDFFAFWVNNRESTAGICSVTPKRGDQLLFFVDTCTYDPSTQACSNQPVLPLAVRAPRTAGVGRRIQLTIVRYSKTGKPAAVADATVKRNGVAIGKTDSHGHLRVTLRRHGLLRFQATKTGFARSATVVVRAHA